MSIELTELSAHVLGNRYIGLSVSLIDDGFEVVGCEAIMQKGNLQVLSSFSFANDFSDLAKYVTGSYPIFLTVDGRGILHKRIVNLNSDAESAHTALFPGINRKDFWIQQSEIADGVRFLSVGRKESVDQLLKQLSELNFNVMYCCLGPFFINKYLPYIKPTVSKLQLGYLELSIVDGLIDTVSRVPNSIKSNYCLLDDSMDGAELLPFALILSHISSPFALSGELDIPEVINNREKAKYKILFWRSLVGGSILLLCILLFNFFFYSSYSAEISGTRDEYNRNKVLIKQLNSIEKELIEKRKFVDDNKLLNNLNIALYCDKIGASLSDEISLEQLQVNPIIGRVRSDKPIKYVKDVVRIEGVASSAEDLSRWLDKLKNESWVEGVQIERFMNEADQLISFVIIMQLKIEDGEKYL